jgi:hypothetical protein
MRTACASVFCGLLLFCSTASLAQTSGKTGVPSSILSGGINLRAVAGAPFSANVVRESVQVMADGTRTAAEHRGKMFRDSEGRTRSETELESPQAGAGHSSGRYVTIIDPVQQISIVLNVEAKTAAVFHLPPASAASGRDLKLAAAAQAARTGGAGRAATAGAEDLGAMMIEGFSVAGSRRTNAAEAGAGKDKVVTESWFSPELKVELLSTQVSQSLSRTTRLVNIAPGEPDPALFQVPADYAVQENPAAK